MSIRQSGLPPGNESATTSVVSGNGATDGGTNPRSAPVIQRRKQGAAVTREINFATLAQVDKSLGPYHPITLTVVSNLAMELQAQGEYGRAEQLNRRALEGRENMRGPCHPETMI
ncbi:hypothetical protein L873DRAFT_1775292, partial [Choiromyces venosus 120613-1]